jgi:hypothetical protein
MNSSVKINFKKTRKGKINKIVEEVYLRDDISAPCKIGPISLIPKYWSLLEWISK